MSFIRRPAGIGSRCLVSYYYCCCCQYIVTSSQEAAATAPLTGAVVGRHPKHPEYSQLQQRATSFHGKRVPAGQSVDVLARAGFFHVGKSRAK